MPARRDTATGADRKGKVLILEPFHWERKPDPLSLTNPVPEPTIGRVV
jgi:hypothetical protein